MTTKSRTRRLCTDCKIQLNRSNCDPSNNCPDVCNRCFDMAGYENEHLDGYHDDEPLTGICPSCSPEIVKDHSRKGHEGTTVARGSHAECYAKDAHPKTKEGRAACRKSRTA